MLTAFVPGGSASIIMKRVSGRSLSQICLSSQRLTDRPGKPAAAARLIILYAAVKATDLCSIYAFTVRNAEAETVMQILTAPRDQVCKTGPVSKKLPFHTLSHPLHGNQRELFFLNGSHQKISKMKGSQMSVV